MARSRPSIMKRKRELARQERRQGKLARRARRTADKQHGQHPVAAPDNDPDIAHIVPGPQALPWESFDTDLVLDIEVTAES